MLTAPGSTTLAESALLLTGLLAAGFLVSWLAADVLQLPRRLYIAILGIITAAATIVVAESSGTSVGRVFGHRWALGLVGAAVAGAVTGLGIRRAGRSVSRPVGGVPPAEVAWEGVVYGLAEGILLSALPAFVLWQASADEGWSTGAAWAGALAASVVMIAVHHFGYWDFRGPLVGLAVVACGILSVAYLMTGSIVAPAVGHVIMHVVGVTGGVELPPHARPAAAQQLPRTGRRARAIPSRARTA